MKTEAVLPDTSVRTREKTPNQTIGNPDGWKLLSKTFNLDDGWSETESAREVPGGSVLRVQTMRRSQVAVGSPFVISEALVFIPYAFILPDVNGGHRLAGPHERTFPAPPDR